MKTQREMREGYEALLHLLTTLILLLTFQIEVQNYIREHISLFAYLKALKLYDEWRADGTIVTDPCFFFFLNF
jgi:hypothetical protein